MYNLMERAGQAAFDAMRLNWPEARNILVLIGSGNNGGDGLILARHAKAAGIHVEVRSQSPDKALNGDALSAYQS